MEEVRSVVVKHHNQWVLPWTRQPVSSACNTALESAWVWISRYQAKRISRSRRHLCTRPPAVSGKCRWKLKTSRIWASVTPNRSWSQADGTTTRKPMVEPGKASGTTGSTVSRQCGHQYRGMVCSVTTGVMSAGMSSMIRVREERHARTGPWHLGQADSVCSSRRSIRDGVGRRCPGCPGLAPLGLARPLVVGLTYGGVCPEGADGSGVVETTTCFSASCLAKDNKAKTTASAPCA